MTNIYVGNLAWAAGESDVRAAFEPFGDVSAVHVIMDRETGRARGFAFVEMPSAEEAKEAIENVNGTEICGRAVTVNEARPREERPRRGGGGGYGGGGGGGYGGGGGGGYGGGGGGYGGGRGGYRD